MSAKSRPIGRADFAAQVATVKRLTAAETLRSLLAALAKDSDPQVAQWAKRLQAGDSATPKK